jgi:uncharacterized protein (DUF1015 family)
MADIRPFRAVRYNPDKIKDLCDVTTPPYDVIDVAFQDKLYERSPHNFVRLDLGRQFETDDADDNRYTRAAELYKNWRDSDVLIREEQPAFYVYKQTFEADGETIVRNGFMGIVRVHDYEDRVILPHERTLKGPKVDRLELMKATNTQLSQLFLLYNDEEQSVDDLLAEQCEREPDMDVTCDSEVRHQIWIVDDSSTIAKVVLALENEQLLIADGHHRYETAVAFRDLEPSDGDDRPRDFAMVYLANAADPGLQVWPTHRAIHSLDSFDFDSWMNAMEQYFEVSELGDIDLEETYAALEEAGQEQPSFVVLRQDDDQLRKFLLTLKQDEASEEIEKLDVVDEAKKLDVTILHDFVLAKLTGISLDAQAAKTNIRYPRSLEAARKAAERDDTEMVFLMNPTPIQQIREVCLSGGFMPQKSTYFFPKVLSGLVINDLTSF